MEPSSSEEDKRDAQLEIIFRTHVTDLYRYIYRQVHHAIIAEDLTSDIFLKALRWLQLERGPESVKGWLYATARSLIANYWHEQGRADLLPLEAADEMPMFFPKNDVPMKSLQARIQHLFDGLSTRDREILTLRYLQSYSTAEIGQILGVSANYVRVLQLRALRRAALLESRERIVPMEAPNIPYNEQALRVLKLTDEEAHTLNHNYMGTEHLLLGILHEGSAAEELINHGVTLDSLRGGIMFIIGYSTLHVPEKIGFTPRAREVLSLAASEAQRMGEKEISPQHLLVAILREGNGIAAQLLQISGVRLEQVGNTAQIMFLPESEEPVTLPIDFQQALEPYQDIRAMFEKLSPAKQKRFIDRIEHSNNQTRNQTVEETIQQLKRILQSHQQGQQRSQE